MAQKNNNMELIKLELIIEEKVAEILVFPRPKYLFHRVEYETITGVKNPVIRRIIIKLDNGLPLPDFTFINSLIDDNNLKSILSSLEQQLLMDYKK